MPITVEVLASQLYVDPGDIRVLVARFDPEDGGPDTADPNGVEMLSDELGGEIRMILEPRSERTLPHLYNQAAMDDWREEHGIRPPSGEANHAPGQPFGLGGYYQG